MENAKTHSDKELLLKIAEGDEAAFSSLFRKYRNKIYTIAFQFTESEPLAEEILLDVFLKVWLKREKLAEVEYFTAYLFTITRNHVFSTLKQLALRRSAENVVRLEEYLLHSQDAGNRVMEKEYEQILQEAIKKLSPQQRKVYTLIKEQGLKREEVAAQLQLSPETVKRHLAEAMNVIRIHCIDRLGVFGGIIVLRQLL